MKTQLSLLITSLIISTSMYCQISITKKNVAELFFEIQVSPAKFDVRKLIHSSNNFFGFGGIDYGSYETITAGFKQNFKLSYLGRDEKNIVFWFDNGTEISNSRKINTEYFPDEYALCLKQLGELYNIFIKCSFKSEKRLIRNNKNEKSGEGWHFYSSEKSFKDGKPYLVVHYRYFKVKYSLPTSLKEEGYIFEIDFHDENLY